MKVVIVGGVAGGASAAARMRRNDENAEILLLERGEYISFANCGLPYHIGGIIPERESLLLLRPDEFRSMFNVEARVKHEVVSIDRQKKNVTVKDWSRDVLYTEPYDKLVLSPGAAPIMPPIEGIDLPGIFSLRNVPDMDRIKAYIETKNPDRVAVIGGGFIGVELAENLQHIGMQVTLVEMMDQVMTPIDFDMASMVHTHMAFKKVRLALGDGLSKINETNDGLTVTLQSGKTVDVDMVIMAIGVRPENTLAKQADLELGARGTIKTNQHMQTNDPDIYAIGDAAEVYNTISGQRSALPLAGPASKQGRIVADHISGKDASFKGVIGTSVVKVFDLTVAATGLNARALEQAGIDYQSAVVHVSNHAGYYPGASPMALKLHFAKDGKVLGFQAVGIEGVDKRVDVVATAIHAGMTVYDLEELELAYAPPFGSSRDPINIIGFVAANALRGNTRLVHWSDLQHLDPEKQVLLDVREDIEVEIGHIEGAMHIPWPELRDRMGELPKDKEIIVYCQVGKRGYFAEQILRLNGFKAANLTGGFKTYSQAIEKQSNFDVYEFTQINKTEEITDIPPQEELRDAKEIVVDACGLQCPGPIMKLYNTMKEARTGDVIHITATDFGFLNDARAWVEKTGNTLLSIGQEENKIIARIQKGEPKLERSSHRAPSDGKTMVVFSGDLDKVLAAFIIANGSASMGHPVTMFFTFWGLNALRKPEKVNVKKTFIERMFGWMMPRGADKMTLSQMNMAGAGTAMIKGIMKKKNVDALPEMIRMAQENGVRLQACQMSMDLMGIKKEELLDGVEIVGVASFVASSDDSNATLFI
ncbi:MAG: FAD-dependent oxidoreductase [Anaerolineae bacterium]|jgi:NADPH-dependent 2,4-dienoyl-CoA reductase/sulfur reductase-like enzyme/peroxiredoxin family protein/rhodanese-related sulfurtransferase/TusA-related sulfurtransferase|nr:FAD-dependent oxidoreductase [Anaerolineae bacterium]